MSSILTVTPISTFLALPQGLWKWSAPGSSTAYVAFLKAQAQGTTVSPLVNGGSGLGSCVSEPFQFFSYCAKRFL
jgi:hypothetical protein